MRHYRLILIAVLLAVTGLWGASCDSGSSDTGETGAMCDDGKPANLPE